MATIKTAKYLGWEISRGALKTCKSCTIRKARQKNVPKESSNEKAKVPNGCWFHNIATVKAPERLDVMVMYPVWHIIVDKASVTKISGFCKA